MCLVDRFFGSCAQCRDDINEKGKEEKSRLWQTGISPNCSCIGIGCKQRRATVQKVVGAWI